MNARDDKALAGASTRGDRAGQGAPAPLLGTSTRTLSRSLASVSAARQRKLHVGHFAFMRSVVQGLDPRESWERYFRVEGEATDQRTVRATIAWIRDEFAAAAKRQDRYGTARLVRIDATRIADPSLELPSLEAFAEAQGLEHERQAEQMAAYEAEYGRATQRLRRRARLVARQLEALRWLEGLVAQSPKAGDSVAAWLNPTLASHLEAADIFTLAQLVERINGVGRRWHAGIKAMGESKALRIVDWLREHQDSIELQLGRHVAMARSKLYVHELNAVVAPATAIRPLEKFIVPAELDGTRGLYRRPQTQCLLKATNDYQAILAWLRSKHGLTPDQKAHLKARRRHRDVMGNHGVEQSMDWLQALSNTQRAYRKEAERFLLWAITHKGKALSSMSNEDCIEYRDFLADPQPRSRWCGDRGRERWSPLWRPFEGPLSASAQRHAVTILKNLYGFLVDQNYLMGNPWSAVGVPRTAGPKVNAGRSFSLAQWDFIEEQLKMLPATSANQRLTFGLHLLYATGLRLSEVVAATVDDMQWVEYPADAHDDEPMQGWLLRVVGKGQKEREVPLPADVVGELARYLASRGLDADPEDIGNQGAFLLGKASDAAQRAPGLSTGQAIDPRQGIAATTFYDQIKAFFADCASVLRGQGDAKGAERFARASTHWMRHSHASHAIAGGMPIEIAQQNLGHASLATTTVYVTTEKRRRMRAVETFWGTGRAVGKSAE
ncbi:phage integrase family protein [Methylibium sp.]|uniref:phage integrase family protein n=1 Tax=Methylibium sp. TaxID=2067992 RepID=UPI0017CAD782|nr:phage integrase family protein [Methylibium sp.]MBA3588416.1 tyrosine-type recombinase/integrase [Methylibium sp.]